MVYKLPHVPVLGLYHDRPDLLDAHRKKKLHKNRGGIPETSMDANSPPISPLSPVLEPPVLLSHTSRPSRRGSPKRSNNNTLGPDAASRFLNTTANVLARTTNSAASSRRSPSSLGGDAGSPRNKVPRKPQLPKPRRRIDFYLSDLSRAAAGCAQLQADAVTAEARANSSVGLGADVMRENVSLHERMCRLQHVDVNTAVECLRHLSEANDDKDTPRMQVLLRSRSPEFVRFVQENILGEGPPRERQQPHASVAMTPSPPRRQLKRSTSVRKALVVVATPTKPISATTSAMTKVESPSISVEQPPMAAPKRPSRPTSKARHSLSPNTDYSITTADLLQTVRSPGALGFSPLALTLGSEPVPAMNEAEFRHHEQWPDTKPKDKREARLQIQTVFQHRGLALKSRHVSVRQRRRAALEKYAEDIRNMERLQDPDAQREIAASQRSVLWQEAVLACLCAIKMQRRLQLSHMSSHGTLRISTESSWHRLICVLRPFVLFQVDCNRRRRACRLLRTFLRDFLSVARVPRTLSAYMRRVKLIQRAARLLQRRMQVRVQLVLLQLIDMGQLPFATRALHIAARDAVERLKEDRIRSEELHANMVAEYRDRRDRLENAISCCGDDLVRQTVMNELESLVVPEAPAEHYLMSQKECERVLSTIDTTSRIPLPAHVMRLNLFTTFSWELGAFVNVARRAAARHTKK